MQRKGEIEMSHWTSRPAQGRGLFYTRDSGGKHEMTPGQYVEWAAREAHRLGVSFNGNAATIQSMMRDGSSQRDDVFLDFGVKGNQLSRPGLDRLLAEALGNPEVSHVFIPRRDRLARPDNPVDGILLELQFRMAGITLVFMDCSCAPIEKGQRHDISDLIRSMVAYDRAGMDRRDLAQKIIDAQVALSKAGYATGGRPPYGFRRWLVTDAGNPVRQLVEGELVRMPGHHVVWLPVPEDHREMRTIRRILELIASMPASQVAKRLTDEGVPTPDAGRMRTNNGVRHYTSGVWHQSTVVNIARNSLLVAIASFGRRSMGDQLRFTPRGPRPLQREDFRSDGEPKVVRNPEQAVHRHPARFEPLVDPANHQKLLEVLDERAGTQRGKPRSRDPAKNPLGGGSIVDMNCRWPMYRVPSAKGFRYTCGLYMQSHGAKCDHNHVDGLAVTRFVLTCVRERVLRPESLAKLRARLFELARQEYPSKHPNDASSDTAQLEKVNQNLAAAKRNLALAQNEEQYACIAEVFQELQEQKASLEARIEAASSARNTRSSEDEVQAALAVLDSLPKLIADSENLAAIGAAFRLINVRVFLCFLPVQKKKRILNKVAGGVVTFGSAHRLWHFTRDQQGGEQ
jgi:hypothetical protein